MPPLQYFSSFFLFFSSFYCSAPRSSVKYRAIFDLRLRVAFSEKLNFLLAVTCLIFQQPLIIHSVRPRAMSMSNDSTSSNFTRVAEVPVRSMMSPPVYRNLDQTLTRKLSLSLKVGFRTLPPG